LYYSYSHVLFAILYFSGKGIAAVTGDLVTVGPAAPPAPPPSVSVLQATVSDASTSAGRSTLSMASVDSHGEVAGQTVKEEFIAHGGPLVNLDVNPDDPYSTYIANELLANAVKRSVAPLVNYVKSKYNYTEYFTNCIQLIIFIYLNSGLIEGGADGQQQVLLSKDDATLRQLCDASIADLNTCSAPLGTSLSELLNFSNDAAKIRVACLKYKELYEKTYGYQRQMFFEIAALQQQYLDDPNDTAVFYYKGNFQLVGPTNYILILIWINVLWCVILTSLCINFHRLEGKRIR